MNTGPLVPNDGRDVQPVTGDLGGAGQASTFGPPPPSTSWDGKLSSNPVFGDITIVAPPGAKPTIRFVPAPLRPGELHGLLFGDGKPGENQPEPDQKYQPRPGSTRQGEAPVKAGAIENNNNNNNKRDNSNRETHTERGPGGHSSKTSSNNNPRPASLSASPQQTAKLTEFDTSHMGLASKKTDSAIAKERETAPLTKLDTSHLGMPSSNSTKPTPTPARPQQAGKLTAFDTSHMGVAAKLQSFAKPASPTAARTLASQH
jgi:hypothetical protein